MQTEPDGRTAAESPERHAVDRQPGLLRVLGLRETTALVIGGILGSAIFIVPAEITGQTGSEGAALSVWIAAGLLSLFGALAYGELAAMLPQAGGQYVFLREAYGPLVAFLCGWIFFWATQSGAIATLAVGLAQYLAGFVPLTSGGQKAVAALVVALLTAVNYRGVRGSGRLQSAVTGMTIGAIVILVALGWALAGPKPAREGPLPLPAGHSFLSSFALAMIAALWAYEGWNSGTFFAGEVKRPSRNLPLALALGMSAVVVIDLTLNLVYYRVLTPREIAASPRVAADAARHLMGVTGARLTSLVILITIFGCINSSILTAARVYYAMAEDGLFFRWCAAVHSRFRTPHRALVAQAVWSVALVLVGGYEQLYTYVVFAAWILYALTVSGVIILRHKRPDLPRPYRVTGYPWAPIVFVVAAAALVANTVVRRPFEAGWGSLIVASGVLVYLIRRGWGKGKPALKQPGKE